MSDKIEKAMGIACLGIIILAGVSLFFLSFNQMFVELGKFTISGDIWTIIYTIISFAILFVLIAFFEIMAVKLLDHEIIQVEHRRYLSGKKFDNDCLN